MLRNCHPSIHLLVSYVLILGLGSAFAAQDSPSESIRGAVIHEGTFNSGDLSWERNRDGHFIPSLPETKSLSETNKPVLVRQNLQLLVPMDAAIGGIEVVPLQTHQEPLPGPVGLGRPMVSDQGEEFAVDRLALGKTVYPQVWGEYAGTHTRRGFRLVSVQLYPVRILRDDLGQWSAVEVLDRYEIRILPAEFPSSPDIAQRLRFVPGERERIERILARRVANPEALAGYDRQDGIMVPEPAGGFQPTRTPTLSGSTVSYLIITSELLADEFQVLADFKTAQGLPTIVATVEWIAANFRNGCDIQETIRMFIREAYQVWGVEWVLLGGDTNILPARFVISTYYPPQSYTEIPADLYFACLDGNWNADGDYVFGEPYTHYLYPGDEADLEDEVYIGRAPVSTETMAVVFVDKVINYMDAPVEAQWTNNVLFASEVLFPSDWNQGDYIVLDGATFSEALKDNYIDTCTNMETTRMYENYNVYIDALPLTRTSLIDSLNTGHYGIVNQIGHGFYFNMSVGDANFVNSDADALVNGPPFIIYALNCASAAFDKACLMERFIQNPNGGAVAAIGSARAAFPHTSNGYQEVFFNDLYCQETNRLGELISLSREPFLDGTYYNTVDRWTFMNYTLLGDPTLSVWTAMAKPLQITAPPVLSAGAQDILVVVESEGIPVPNASVCLTKAGEDYVTGTTDISGLVILSFTPTSGGNAILTVSGTNLKRQQVTIPVNSGPAYVAVADVESVDDGSVGSIGNSNSVAEAGETVALYLNCQDNGGAGAIDCSAILTTSEPSVIIIDGTAYVGDVPAGGQLVAAEPFLVELPASLGDGHRVSFEVVVTDQNSDMYETKWTLTVRAPEVEPIALDWEDWSFGDGDGTIEDSERIGISVTLKNFGVGLSGQIMGILRSTDLQVTLHDSIVTYSDIGLLETSSGGGVFSFSDANVAELSWCWILFQDDYGRTFRHDFQLDPPSVPEGMEADSSEGPDIISLIWLPLQDEDARGYHVYRSDAPAGPFTRVNVDLIDGVSYFRDTGLALLTRYYYRITAVDSSLTQGLPSLTISHSTSPPELNGFPLPFATETSGHCAVGDVTGDGRLEIVLGADEIYVWRDDGSELFDGDNDAQTHGPITGLDGDFQPAGIALADLDGLPGLEIIASNRVPTNEIRVFKADGSDLPGWPKQLRSVGSGWNWATPAVGDVDGDSDPEIVVNTGDGYTWIWHADGTELIDGDNNPATDGVFRIRGVNEWGKCSPALHDLDGDGAQDIIFGTKYGNGWDNQLIAYKADTTQVPGFPYSLGTTGKVYCSPTVADLNGDGIWEIIFITKDNFLYVVQQDGTDYTGFPIPFTFNTEFCPSPAVGDFDQDGHLEIAAVATIGLDQAELIVIDTDIIGGTSGQVLPGWPQALPGNTESSPVVGDIDGDSVPDIIHGIGGGSEDSPDNLYAFKADGSYVDGFPISLLGPARSSAVICDLDQDGDVDIVHGSWGRVINVWDMPFDYDEENIPWPTFRGHSCRDGVHHRFIVPDDVPPDPIMATELLVEPPYPNPFNPATTVKLYLPGKENSSQPLQVVIYDLQGRRIRVLHDGLAQVGWHSWIWDGRNSAGRHQASGLYFLRARSRDQSVIHKMSLIK